MAAETVSAQHSDVESCSTALPSDTETSSTQKLSDESDNSRDSSSSSLPGYRIVQRQIQDAVLMQQAAVEQLIRNNIDVLNVSKESFDRTLSSQEQKVKMLERSIMEDYILKEMYDSLNKELKESYVPKENLENVKKRLEEERERHGQTQTKLQETLDKLETSLIQITTLKRQMDEDKTLFDAACKNLKDEVSQTHARHAELEVRLNEKSLECDRQKCQILELQNKVDTLQQQQKNQTLRYKQMMMESEVERQQEVYLNQVLAGRMKAKS